MGRATKPDKERAKNSGLPAYPGEIAAIKDAARAEKFKGPFDFVRDCVIKRDHPATRGKISEPRQNQRQSSDPVLAPSTRRRPRA